MATRKRRRPTAERKVVSEVVTRKVKVNGIGGGPSEAEDVREVSVHEFVTDPAYLRVNAGATKNLGDFESLRVDVALSVPCYKEDIERTFEEASEWVAGKLSQEIENYLSEDEDEDEDE